MTIKNLGSILSKTFSAWSDHDAPRLGAALAFYSILSLAPLLVLVLAIVATVLGHSTAQERIIAVVQGTIGSDGGNAVRGMIESARTSSSGILASIAGGVALLFGASGVFGELRAALNKMWDVEAGRQDRVWAAIKERFFSFGIVIAVGFLLLISLVLSAALTALGGLIGDLPLPGFRGSGLRIAVSIAATSLLFALIFKYLPEAKVDWKDVWFGALATAQLVPLGKLAIGFYIGKAAVGSGYGAAGSLVVVTVWIYYSSMIFLFGAEFTHELQDKGLIRSGLSILMD
jgi:membrane protein